MPKFEDISVDADKDSNEYALALMVKQFPGSWLPYGDEQVIKNAAPFMKLISKKQRPFRLYTNHKTLAQKIQAVQLA